MLSEMSLKKLFYLLFVSLLLSFFVSGCNVLDPQSDEESDDDLYVQFNNDSSSSYTITCIELMPIGSANETPSPSGEWTSNKLENAGDIPPGGQQYFHAKIPRQHRCYYRLGVKNGDGTTLMLNEQTHYANDDYPTLTHWGSDERTVTVTIVNDSQNGLIYINGWSEWAGIE